MSPRQNQVLDHDLLVFHPLGLPLQVASSLSERRAKMPDCQCHRLRARPSMVRSTPFSQPLPLVLARSTECAFLMITWLPQKKTVLVVIQLPCSSKAFNLTWVWCGDGKTSIPVWVVPLTKAIASDVHVMTKSLFHAKYVCTLVVFWWYIHGFFCLGLVSVDQPAWNMQVLLNDILLESPRQRFTSRVLSSPVPARSENAGRAVPYLQNRYEEIHVMEASWNERWTTLDPTPFWLKHLQHGKPLANTTQNHKLTNQTKIYPSWYHGVLNFVLSWDCHLF